MDYYFSKIELYDKATIVTPSIRNKITQMSKRKVERLEKQGILVGKDPKKLLRKAQKMESKEDLSEDQQARRQWRIAMLRAQGCKVKDNMDMLKKSVKREQKLKKRRYDKWQERKRQVEDLQKERQNKRQENIQKRKDSKLSGKLRKAKKKGRVFKMDHA